MYKVIKQRCILFFKVLSYCWLLCINLSNQSTVLLLCPFAVIKSTEMKTSFEWLVSKQQSGFIVKKWKQLRMCLMSCASAIENASLATQSAQRSDARGMCLLKQPVWWLALKLKHKQTRQSGGGNQFRGTGSTGAAPVTPCIIGTRGKKTKKKQLCHWNKNKPWAVDQRWSCLFFPLWIFFSGVAYHGHSYKAKRSVNTGWSQGKQGCCDKCGEWVTVCGGHSSC